MTNKHALSDARQYEAEYLNMRAGKPLFHMTCPVGWMNDPNGFSCYKATCHLFFQYHPYDITWGPMHWGHAVSEDFIKWRHLPAALAPDERYDNQGCFSGSALAVNGEHVLLYTGVHNGEPGSGYEDELVQEQCIAVGDGLNYKKYEHNPVITAELLPAGHSVTDFRDPKLYRWKDKYRAIIGNTDAGRDGFVVVFESANLKDWKFIGTLDCSDFEYGSMWECPDLFELDGRDVLVLSPQFIEAKGLEFHNGNCTMCIAGKIQEEKMVREFLHAIDYGLDFYAPQTLQTNDGRRIMIGWLQSWDNFMTPAQFNWSGIMSIPRELSIENDRLYQRPVKELYDYRKKEVVCEAKLTDEERSFDGIRGRVFDMEIDFSNIDGRIFEIGLACDDRHKTLISIDAKMQQLTFDRTCSGLKKDILCTRSMKVDKWEAGSSLRIIMDRYTVEIFVNNGKYAMSSLIYTPVEAENISFRSEGMFEFRIKKYEIDLNDRQID